MRTGVDMSGGGKWGVDLESCRCKKYENDTDARCQNVIAQSAIIGKVGQLCRACRALCARCNSN